MHPPLGYGTNGLEQLFRVHATTGGFTYGKLPKWGERFVGQGDVQIYHVYNTYLHTDLYTQTGSLPRSNFALRPFTSSSIFQKWWSTLIGAKNIIYHMWSASVSFRKIRHNSTGGKVEPQKKMALCWKQKKRVVKNGSFPNSPISVPLKAPT